MGFKAAIFDIDGTLYDYPSADDAAMRALSVFAVKELSITQEMFDDYWGEAKRQVKDVIPEHGASHNRLLYLQRMLELMGKKPLTLALRMYDVYWNSFLEAMVPASGLQAAFQNLQNEGIKIGICSDLTAHIQHRKLDKLGIGKFVDAIVTSEEAGSEKPAPIMFKLIAKKLSVDPQDCLFVGDNYERDILGAQSAGMTAMLIGDGGDAEGTLAGSKLFDVLRRVS